MHDVAVPERNQVIDRKRGPDMVVGGNGVDPGVCAAGPDDDRRYDVGRTQDVLVAEFGAHQDERFDLELQVGFNRPSFSLGIAASVKDQDLKSVRFGGGLNPVDDLSKERVVDVVDDHAEGLGALLGQAAGVEVRPVAELGGSLQDCLTLGVGHLGRVVHDQAHQRTRDASAFSDGLHRRSAHGPSLALPGHTNRRRTCFRLTSSVGTVTIGAL